MDPFSDLSSQLVMALAAAADRAIMRCDPVFDESLIAELQPGERLLWSGRPDTSPWLVPDDRTTLPISVCAAVFTIGFAAIIVTSTMGSGVSAFGVFASLWGLMLAGFGLYVAVGRLFARRYFGPRTVYGLTNLRALVSKPGWRGGRQTTFVWLASGLAVYQRNCHNGHATVMIGATLYQRAAVHAGDPGWLLAKPYERPLAAFWNIADAAEVSCLAERLIGEAQSLSEPAQSLPVSSPARTASAPPVTSTTTPVRVKGNFKLTVPSAVASKVKAALESWQGPNVQLRASDEDRERTVRSLRAHFAAGRLPADEFEQRVAKVYAARTRRELAGLLSDLPADRLGRAVRSLYFGQRTAFGYHAATYVAVNGILLGVWELAGHGWFWPGLVLAPMTALLGLHAATSRALRRRLQITKGRDITE